MESYNHIITLNNDELTTYFLTKDIQVLHDLKDYLDENEDEDIIPCYIYNLLVSILIDRNTEYIEYIRHAKIKDVKSKMKGVLVIVLILIFIYLLFRIATDDVPLCNNTYDIIYKKCIRLELKKNCCVELHCRNRNIIDPMC